MKKCGLSGSILGEIQHETGSTNVIVWKRLREAEHIRPALLHARLLVIYGRWEHDQETGGRVRHLIAGFAQDLTDLLGGLSTESRDFR